MPRSSFSPSCAAGTWGIGCRRERAIRPGRRLAALTWRGGQFTVHRAVRLVFGVRALLVALQRIIAPNGGAAVMAAATRNIPRGLSRRVVTISDDQSPPSAAGLREQLLSMSGATIGHTPASGRFPCDGLHWPTMAAGTAGSRCFWRELPSGMLARVESGAKDIVVSTDLRLSALRAVVWRRRGGDCADALAGLLAARGGSSLADDVSGGLLRDVRAAHRVLFSDLRHRNRPLSDRTPAAVFFCPVARADAIAPADPRMVSGQPAVDAANWSCCHPRGRRRLSPWRRDDLRF